MVTEARPKYLSGSNQTECLLVRVGFGRIVQNKKSVNYNHRSTKSQSQIQKKRIPLKILQIYTSTNHFLVRFHRKILSTKSQFVNHISTNLLSMKEVAAGRGGIGRVGHGLEVGPDGLLRGRGEEVLD